MNKSEIEINEDYESTYCPEDDKLRLYVGRVGREEYLMLKDEGWISTPKQDCDFVAVWIVERENTALIYGNGFIGDEDQGPAERAADRAERFQGYQEKRFNEACSKADQYESKDTLHGFQRQEKADRAAKRHDRIADKACGQWRKAEYWQQRTAGVISSALYKDRPGVRMGRIKKIETSLRKYETYGEGYDRVKEHLKNRLVYENAMLEGQGGRLEQKDIEVGGKISGRLIIQVHKSIATKRVTSASVLIPAIKNGNSWQMKQNIAGTPYAKGRVKTERMSLDSYTEPTGESLKELKEFKALKKAGAKLKPKSPALINPTMEAALELQKYWNDKAVKSYKGSYTGKYSMEPKKEDLESLNQAVLTMTQEQYSKHSAGSYASFETHKINTSMELGGHWSEKKQTAFKVRLARAKDSSLYMWAPHRVIVITDKPQKAFPCAIQDQSDLPHDIDLIALDEAIKAFNSCGNERPTDEQRKLCSDAALFNLCSVMSYTQVSWTDKGMNELKELKEVV